MLNYMNNVMRKPACKIVVFILSVLVLTAYKPLKTSHAKKNTSVRQRCRYKLAAANGGHGL